MLGNGKKHVGENVEHINFLIGVVFKNIKYNFLLGKIVFFADCLYKITSIFIILATKLVNNKHIHYIRDEASK